MAAIARSDFWLVCWAVCAQKSAGRSGRRRTGLSRTWHVSRQARATRGHLLDGRSCAHLALRGHSHLPWIIEHAMGRSPARCAAVLVFWRLRTAGKGCALLWTTWLAGARNRLGRAGPSRWMASMLRPRGPWMVSKLVLETWRTTCSAESGSGPRGAGADVFARISLSRRLIQSFKKCRRSSRRSGLRRLC